MEVHSWVNALRYSLQKVAAESQILTTNVLHLDRVEHLFA
jgi:hypothetical protein